MSEPERDIAWKLKHANKNLYKAEQKSAENNMDVRVVISEARAKILEVLEKINEEDVEEGDEE